MILDILILTVLGVTIFFSMRKGFVMALTGFFRGVVSLILAWIFCDDLAAYLSRTTSLDLFFQGKIQSLLKEKLEALGDGPLWEDFLPDLYRQPMEAGFDSIFPAGASLIADFVITALCFVLIVVGIQLAGWLLTRLFSHRFRGGFIGFTDYLFGLLIGIFLGAFNVMLLLAFLPVVQIMMPELGETLAAWLETSYFAKDLYDNNLLLILIQQFLLPGTIPESV